MATSTPVKYAIQLRLNNGLDPDGNVKVAAISLPKLSVSGYTDEKALAVVAAIEACLSKELIDIYKIFTSAIESE